MLFVAYVLNGVAIEPDGESMVPFTYHWVAETHTKRSHDPIAVPVVVALELNLTWLVPFAAKNLGPSVAEGVTSVALNISQPPSKNVVPASVITTWFELDWLTVQIKLYTNPTTGAGNVYVIPAALSNKLYDPEPAAVRVLVVPPEAVTAALPPLLVPVFTSPTHVTEPRVCIGLPVYKPSFCLITGT